MNNRLTSFIEEASTVYSGITEEIATALLKYGDNVLSVNNDFNLTAITEPIEMERKHLIDSLSIIGLPELKGRVADVGSGPGFPGAVIAIAKPECCVTMIEATEKKMNFAISNCQSVGGKIDGIHGRAEEIARGSLRESFDTVTARAVASLSSLSEYCLPLAKVGGHIIAMKGPDFQTEIEEAQNAIRTLGGKVSRTIQLTLPDGSERAIVIIEKTKHTPEKYPRSGKNIRKNPL